jgi:hypothetical protein
MTKDSVVLDPRLYGATDNRIKGLFTMSYNTQMGYYVVPSNRDRLDNGLISNTYALFSNSSITGNLKIFLNNRKETFIEYSTYSPTKSAVERK